MAEWVLVSMNANASELMENVNRFLAIGVSILLFLGLSILYFLPNKLEPLLYWVLSLVVLFYYLAQWQTHNFQSGYLLEVALQALIIPTFLVFKKTHNRLLSMLMLISAITFLGHGLYAMNFYPRPGYFVDMMSKAFGMSQLIAEQSLFVIGIVDILCLLFIFLRPTQKSILIYMIFWGFFTALARPIFNFSTVFLEESLIIWVPEFLKRGTHFLVPLALLVEYKKLPKLMS
ncbi:MAG: hypothetical protein ACPGEG_02570 [Salibacteraceae bacterium]